MDKAQTYNNEVIRMLPRDWELLSFLEEQGFASYNQLCKRYFNGIQSSCSTRLSLLLKNRYIHKKKLIDIFQTRKSYPVRGKYFPHILNLNIKPNQYVYYIDREYALGFGKSGQLFKPSMVLHQLILNEVRDFLEEEVIHKRILNDPKAKILSRIHLGTGSDTVPDLSLECDHVRIAIELERTLKSRQRYYMRFGALQGSKYTHIIYYYTDESQLRHLLRYAGVSNNIAFAHYKTPNELYSNVFGISDTNTFIHRVLDSRN